MTTKNSCFKKRQPGNSLTVINETTAPSNGQQLSVKHLAMAAIAIAGVDMVLSNPGMIGLWILGIAAAVGWPHYQILKRNWRWGARFLMAGGVACLATVWLTYYTPPAQAAFFSAAETFFTQTFNVAGSGTAVAIVFNALRALYVLYLAVALIGVVNAVRQDEDWQTVARTPVLIVVVVTVADVLTTFITGTGATAGGG